MLIQAFSNEITFEWHNVPFLQRASDDKRYAYRLIDQSKFEVTAEPKRPNSNENRKSSR